MIHFTPTLGIKDTAKNVNGFIKDNMEVFWSIVKPLMPYIIGLYILDIVITNFFMPANVETGENFEFPVGSILAGYFYTCLAITWHRVVIHGADNFVAMNPFKPKKSELAFIGMGIALFMGMFLGGFALGIGAAIVAPAALLLVFPFIIIGTYVWMKVMFYFPSKATAGSITLKESFAMTKGYIWKMLASYTVGILKILLIFIGFLIIAFMVSTALYFVATKIGLSAALAQSLLESVFVIPAVAYFQPIFAVIWVTVLSNYYQYVLQNGAQTQHD